MLRCSSTSSFVTRRSSHSPHDRIYFFQNEAPDKARPEPEKSYPYSNSLLPQKSNRDKQRKIISREGFSIIKHATAPAKYTEPHGAVDSSPLSSHPLDPHPQPRIGPFLPNLFVGE
ncbi:uncharacterized protein RAG0_06948 [Rhynchosporium agropyri]|uniref:Uncharacterized protein n=1 Tax=Rhynchosporium agropyri TaxID=914238 RepID=A0A1E1KJ54_9HELO|nr:uncharacterized protein RAG0_06948 [Rhynchosporium agropyri]